MAYRTKDIPNNIPQRVFDVRNGATLKASLACFYFRNHDTNLHDHIGWPYPNHPDGSCQEKIIEPAPWLPKHIQIEEGSLEPIHLSEEGYTNFSIIIDDSTIASNSTLNINIDPEQDHVIKLNVTVNLPTFTDKPKETGFTIFAINSNGTRDAVCRGIIKVLPGSKYV